MQFFRLIAFLEGLSYVLLLFIAVPIKYLLNDSSYVKMLGMPHGILFVLYIVIALSLRSVAKWSYKESFIILFCSIVPFGTFYVEKKYLRK